MKHLQLNPASGGPLPAIAAHARPARSGCVCLMLCATSCTRPCLHLPLRNHALDFGLPSCATKH